MSRAVAGGTSPAATVPGFVQRAASSLFPGAITAEALAALRPPAVPVGAAPARGLWDPALTNAYFRPRAAGGLGLTVSPAVALRQQGTRGLGLEVSLSDKIATRRAGLPSGADHIPAGMPLMAVPLSAVQRCHGRDEADAMRSVVQWLRKGSARAAYDGHKAAGWDAVARSYRARFEGDNELLHSTAATDWASYVALSRCHHFTSAAAVSDMVAKEMLAGCPDAAAARENNRRTLPHNDDAAGITEDAAATVSADAAAKAAAADAGGATVTLVPGVDFVNHSPTPCAQMHRLAGDARHLSMWANWVAGAHAEHLQEPHVFLVALRDIEDGEEVTITYADFDPKTDASAWRDHVGFVPERASQLLQKDADALAAAHLERFVLAKAPNPAAAGL
eukprot:CAMPEP_0174850452 /NCGR_PEP_ID=MMETSP1114-20130205/19417_1 /TAXON_ID=312471 /ORGANISM="Neobodo designis, Strain CCAP 1951/1" /LENGTH=391 /DNA_ID=CAMNT_0016084913 /DNA_START=122 /DNA_END=1297 /DNA_ORIENTATION=+